MIEEPATLPPSPPAVDRVDLLRYLAGTAYPVDRDALVAIAETRCAPDGVIAVLRSLGAGQYVSRAHLASAIAAFTSR